MSLVLMKNFLYYYDKKFDINKAIFHLIKFPFCSPINANAHFLFLNKYYLDPQNTNLFQGHLQHKNCIPFQ